MLRNIKSITNVSYQVVAATLLLLLPSSRCGCPMIVLLKLQGPIAPASADFIERSFQRAAEEKALLSCCNWIHPAASNGPMQNSGTGNVQTRVNEEKGKNGENEEVQ